MLRVHIQGADLMQADKWERLHSIYRESAALDMPHRSQDEIDAFVGWGDRHFFMASHRDPNLLVGSRHRQNMLFESPQVAVARDNSGVVGYAFSADTTSGNSHESRERQMRGNLARYVWLGEMAVKPTRYRAGIMLQLAHTLLIGARIFRPVSMYVLPDEMSPAQSLALRLGFEQTSIDQLQLFGVGTEPVTQLRMRAPTVQTVLNRLPTPRQ